MPTSGPVGIFPAPAAVAPGGFSPCYPCGTLNSAVCQPSPLSGQPVLRQGGVSAARPPLDGDCVFPSKLPSGSAQLRTVPSWYNIECLLSTKRWDVMVSVSQMSGPSLLGQLFQKAQRIHHWEGTERVAAPAEDPPRLCKGTRLLRVDFGPTRFICTSVPVDADMCAASGAASGAEELRSNVLQLRETVLQQKETILSQKETIRELTTKLGRCESQSTLDAGPGEARTGGGRKQLGSGKNTMGDLSRTPAAETLSQLGQTLQSLKTRLENLEQYSRLNSSSQTNSLKDLLQSKIDDLERQVLSRVNTLEEGKGAPKNDTEERIKIESALTSLHQRISELEKGQKDNRPGDKFQLTFPLRTNYMYAKVRKSLPEMYAFTVCMWLKSSAAPGVGTPFSYAVPGQANELVLIEWGNNPMEILINDKVAKLPFVINDGKWHHICVTWTTRDGVWEAYQDGTQGGNGENLAPYHPIKPQGVLVLGQEQDTLGGGFDATQAFVGELAHFNVWDRKLTPGEVYNLATCSAKALSGNVIAWAESQIEIYGGATKWTFEACRQIN
ncbi:Neuronal pentraxin-1 [Heterocephalus glaber]|uniref:Neuronal pentraxin-1 n=1 Tax=Heterocephalus glaber TaxID=10181 RepID=G5BJ53_HETGA|nr:Neuronal pentraxin-1 [Heterocephalus glaber]